MPFDTSPYPAPPIVYGEWRGINVAFRTSADLVEKLLPEPLKPDATAWGSQDGDVVIVTQNAFAVIKPYGFNYRNTCFMIPATFEGTPGLYMARVYEDAEDPTLLTIWGREVFGMPKLAGQVGLQRDSERVRSTLRAFGATSTDITMTLTGKSAVEPATTLMMYCRKTIPSPDNPGTPGSRYARGGALATNRREPAYGRNQAV
jgi:acetoacetate decarboxylase